MKKILISNNGCDDSTEFIMEVNEEEFKTILKFAKENNKFATYQCKPAIAIYEKFTIIEDEDNNQYFQHDYETDDLTQETEEGEE